LNQPEATRAPWATSAAATAAATVTAPLRFVAFVARTFVAGFRGMPLVDVVLLASRLLVRSLPIVVVVNIFCGAMLTVQAAASLQAFGAASMSGVVVGFGGVREVFPLLAGGALAARSGAEIASELQAMRVTRQVEALEMMGLDPLALLVAPRLLACVVGAPLCVLAAMVAGLFGAHAVGAWQLGIDAGTMWNALLSGVSRFDVAVGGARGMLLGVLIGGVACFEGFAGVDNDAASVGRAAHRAVIRGMVVVCAACLLLSWLIYGRHA
jgi:phospholipid/cholesterol/gamma-HCH transport system permease protein